MLRIALRILLIASIAFCLLGVAAVVIRHNNPWSRLESEDEEIDIRSGRIRYTSYKYFRKITERIEDSEITKSLLPSDLQGQPQWHTVNTFAPGLRYSPHYRFHSATHQIRELEMIWSLLPESQNTPELKRATARHVLALWQQSRNDNLVDYYLHKFSAAFTEEPAPWIEKLTAMEMPTHVGHGDRVVQTYSFPNGDPLLEITGYLKPDGEFVSHGTFAQWGNDGALYLYGRHEHDKLHGVRFDWTGSGEVSGTEFRNGEFSRWLKYDVFRHPDYAAALDLRKAGKQ